jgi:uncharacterized protein involved in exopolysaccharide biosynthesis
MLLLPDEIVSSSHSTAPYAVTSSIDSSDPYRIDLAPERRGLVDLLETLLRYAWLITTLGFLVGVSVVVSGLLKGRLYAAESAFVLDADKPSAGVSGIAAQFGIVIPQGGDGQSPGFYADLLRSPTILRPILDSGVVVPTATGTTMLRLIDSMPAADGGRGIRRFKAMKQLADRVGTNAAQRTGVVTLRVLDPSPQAALAINRRMLALLNEFNITRRRTQASTQRAFVEDRLEKARVALRDAEERMRVFLATNRGFIPSSEANFERQRLERDVSTRSQVYLSLTQSYEQAKVEEIRAAPLVSVIQPPELPVGPEPRHLARKGIVGFLIGTMLGLLLAYLIESLRRARVEHPDAVATISAALADLRHNWWRPWRAIARSGPRPVR